MRFNCRLKHRLFEVHQQSGGLDLAFRDITLREGVGAVDGRNVGGTLTFVNSILEDNVKFSSRTAHGADIVLAPSPSIEITGFDVNEGFENRSSIHSMDILFDDETFVGVVLESLMDHDPTNDLICLALG